jgi:RNA polymerase sigma factor (sigma-70 family)
MATAAARSPTPNLPSGFAELYADHYDFVWRCALRLGAQPRDVEDVVQETFVIALRRYDQTHFEAGGPRPSTWLFAILHNVLRNHARGERRRRARLEALANDPPSLEPASAQAESTLGLRLLDEFLRELDSDRRSVFVLAELEGMRGPEIARALGLNPNTVRSRLRAARQAFAAHFEDQREQLVDAAANVAAPSEARARGLALLGLSLEATTKVGASGWLSWLMSARGLLTLTFGSVSLVVLGLALNGDHEPRAPSPVRTTPAAAARDQPTKTPSPLAQLAQDDPEPAIMIQAGVKPRPVRRAESVELDSSEALDRLTRARAALLAGDAAACLALVQDREAWPTSLDARRVGLEIGALCALEQPERARARAAAWQAAHPHARTAVELRAVCWTDDNSLASDGHPPSNGHDAPEEQ